MAESKKARVMIADDERRIRIIIKKAMESMGAEVTCEAADGQEAVEMYKKEKPDLLLLDVNMPIKTGREVLDEVMAFDPNAFVIMLTSVSKGKTIVECLERGAAHYIRKDTKIPEIKKIIKETWADFRKSKGGGHA